MHYIRRDTFEEYVARAQAINSQLMSEVKRELLKYTKLDIHEDDKGALLSLSESLQEQILNKCASKT